MREISVFWFVDRLRPLSKAYSRRPIVFGDVVGSLDTRTQRSRFVAFMASIRSDPWSKNPAKVAYSGYGRSLRLLFGPMDELSHCIYREWG